MTALLASPIALASEHRYRRLPVLPLKPQVKELPSLSIIIPARNEASNLSRLLPSLAKTSYPGTIELIVVDDCSSDKTAQIAQSHNLKLIRLSQLPDGWSGKTYACHQGANAASGEWLLFTDADTIHHTDGPASSVAYAVANGLDGLSIFFKHNTSGVIDTLALSVAFAGLFVGLGKDIPIINGQYFLVRRKTYQEVNGFASVAGERLEDLAIGRRLRQKGYVIPLLRSEAVAEVQMYIDIKSLWQGLSRFSPGSLRWLGTRSILVALFITGVMTPILALISALTSHRSRKWAALSWATVSVAFIPWMRRFGHPRLALLAPLGALLVQAASIFGIARRVLGLGTLWKGRRV